METRMSHGARAPVVRFEVMGQDAAKLQDFYSELLGWRFERHEPLPYGEVPPAEEGIAGGVGQAPEGSPGWTTFYTKVGDLEATMARATALGSRVLMESQELRDRRIAVVTDPEGRPVGLCAEPLRA
jgi:predicted enzyme related to lactoylglutathione lyase